MKNAANDNGRPCGYADVTPEDVRKLFMLRGVLRQIDLATIRHLPPETLVELHELSLALDHACADERERRYQARKEQHRRESKFAAEEKAMKEREALQKRIEQLQKFRGDTATVIPE